ncbi:MAG: hypothetical protein ABIH89_07585 [Elusimicrobiota bacterium]
MMRRSVIILVLIMIFATSSSYPETRRLAIGAGYPYLALAYTIDSRYSAQIRVAGDENIQAYGARCCYNFVKRRESGYDWIRNTIYSKSYSFIPDTLLPFTGIEIDYVNFDEDDISGNGIVIYAFTGAEYSISRSLSISFDIGPAFIGLTEHEFSVTSGGLEWIFDVTLYFGLY